MEKPKSTVRELSRKLSKVRITKQFLSTLVDAECLTSQDKRDILKSLNPGTELLRRVAGRPAETFLLEKEVDKAIASCDYKPPDVLGVTRATGNETQRSVKSTAKGDGEIVYTRMRSSMVDLRRGKVATSKKTSVKLADLERLRKRENEIDALTRRLCDLVMGRTSEDEVMDSVDVLQRVCDYIKDMKNEIIRKGGIDLSEMGDFELIILVKKYLNNSEKTFSNHYSRKFAEEKKWMDTIVIDKEETDKELRELRLKLEDKKKRISKKEKDFEKERQNLEAEINWLKSFLPQEQASKETQTNFAMDTYYDNLNFDESMTEVGSIENLDIVSSSPVHFETDEDCPYKTVVVEASHVRIMSADARGRRREGSAHSRKSALSETLTSDISHTSTVDNQNNEIYLKNNCLVLNNCKNIVIKMAENH